jgi:hypothetical protein
MLSNANQIQRGASGRSQIYSSGNTSPHRRNPASDHNLQQLKEIHYVIHDMTIQEEHIDSDHLVGDRRNAMKMMNDLEDALSSLSDPSLGKISSKIPSKLRSTGCLPNWSPTKFYTGSNSLNSLKQAFPSSSIKGGQLEASLNVGRVRPKLVKAHPWNHAELINNTAQYSCTTMPAGSRDRAHYRDSAVDASEDMWSVETLVGDLDEDIEGELVGTTETFETL